MTRQLDFIAKEVYARGLTDSGLSAAILDCRECIKQDIDPDYYRDEISVYRMEQARRAAKVEKRARMIPVVRPVALTGTVKRKPVYAVRHFVVECFCDNDGKKAVRVHRGTFEEVRDTLSPQMYDNVVITLDHPMKTTRKEAMALAKRWGAARVYR